MDLVILVLCMIVIVKINAAPLGANIPHQNNEFDLPEIARNGFEMVLNATIHEKYEEKLKHQQLNIVIEPGEEDSDMCGTDTVEGVHICILPQDKTLMERSGIEPERDVFEVRINATPDRGNEGELNLVVYIDENYVTAQVTTFEKFKHVSIRGVIGTIKQLHFDFSESG